MVLTRISCKQSWGLWEVFSEGTLTEPGPALRQRPRLTVSANDERDLVDRTENSGRGTIEL